MKDFKTIDQISTILGIFRDRLLKLLLFSLFVPFSSFGQENGLEFAGKPESKDQRTKLDLNPEGYYSFHDEFELSFSIQLRDPQPATFGYIARIVDIDDQNIDIIFDGPGSHSLHVVYGPSLTKITVPDNDPGIYDNWTEIRLKCNIKNSTLHFYTPDTSILQHDVDLSGKIKIFFGKNDFNPIQTTDVPRMNIKDIRIYQNGKCLHHFPLNELTGNEVKDIISNKKANVQNPGWIKSGYYYWEWSFDTYLNGLAAVCYEPGVERVYMVGDEQMKIFSVLKDSIDNIKYSSRFSNLNLGSQVFYDSITNRLICYNIQSKSVHYFNFSELKWEEISNEPNTIERFWSHNKYHSVPDSVLYIFGGYSQHRYSNLVQQYDFKTSQWDTIQPGGEDFHPRMHAAIGSYADTLFIIGGFGSKAGDQILNPEHYTDLLAFSLKEREFIKKYDFLAPMEEIDFAHSMVINEEDQSYYLLATTIFEYDTYLQLLKGNLADPKLIKLGDKIPYKYHNEYSYSDLFYSKNSQELIAVTSLADWDNNETKITVHKISFPPFIADIEMIEDRTIFGRIIFGFIFLIIVVTVAIIMIKIIKKKKSSSNILAAGSENAKAEQGLPSQNEMLPDKPKITANSILFFGGFQVINKQGDDITRKFTPLLKELFLLIFLHSIKDKGISVPSLTETLWFSMDAKTAKNNRAVNIAKLKNLLSEIDSCTLSRKTSYWQMVFDDSIVYNDYWSCIKIINNEYSLSKEDLLQFLHKIKKGPMLGNVGYEWLDEFKLECSNLIIDSLTRYFEQDKISSNPELTIELADAILIFDMMHEEAISIKCKALVTLGKHSIAKEIFTKFSKDYLALYDEPFVRSFTDIIQN